MTIQDHVNIDLLDADDLRDLLVYEGYNWADITMTDPASVEPPTDTEIEIVRDFLRDLRST